MANATFNKKDKEAWEKHFNMLNKKHGPFTVKEGEIYASADRDYNTNGSPDVFEAKKIKDKKTARHKAKIRQGRGSLGN